MPDDARGPAEEAEAGDLAQQVIDGLAGRLADVLAGDHGHARGSLLDALLEARHGDDDRLEPRRLPFLRDRRRGGEVEQEQHAQGAPHGWATVQASAEHCQQRLTAVIGW
jgi:hypothetical protein